MVKANAYGLGVQPIVARLVKEGCEAFFVATLSEAIQIKPQVPGEIFVFSPPSTDGVLACHAEGCIPVINTVGQLEQAKRRREIPVAVHVDTGMERLGLPIDELVIDDLKSINLCLLMTHLACADEPDNPFNIEQIESFRRVSQRLPGVQTSIGNSAGTLNGELFQGDVARPGIGLYGANPFRHLKNPLEIVARCEAKVIAVRDLKSNKSIGYGGSFVTAKPSKIAVVGMGYADGLPHVLSNTGHLAFGRALLPIRGKISMDLTQVDITNCPEVQVGDWLEFFGDTIDVDDVAKSAQSFGYEFLTGIGSRVNRQYLYV